MSKGRMVACSSSWYSPAGTPDDWMVLPSLSVESPDAVVRWEARAYDRNLSDGYAIYVSTTGTDPDSFDISNPLFSVDAEEAVWTNHEISLSQYIGKEISIAFVNNSTDCAMLLLDNIFAGVPKLIDIALDTPAVVRNGESIPMRFSVRTDRNEPIHGIKVGYQFANQSSERFNLLFEIGLWV